MNNIFVYGTLLNDEILNILISSHVTKRTAVLIGYKRVTVLGEVYPAIFPQKKSKVQGLLLSSLSDEDVKRLDDYEDACYERTPVTVLLPGNLSQYCETFVFQSKYKALLSDTAWSNEYFREKHLQHFLTFLTE